VPAVNVNKGVIRPLTHASEIGAINATPDSGASFSCRCTTFNVIYCLGARRQSMALEIVHRNEKLAPESGVEFKAPVSDFLQRVSGALVMNFCLVLIFDCSR